MTSTWKPLLHGHDAERALQSVREIAAALPSAEAASPFRHASLAGGQAGHALFFSYLALHTGEETAADLAADLLDQASERLAEEPLPPTLYTGFPGVAWTLQHLQGRLFE
ncbi:MAG TPA: lanthionine synthetase LanC family protein, partial [Thermoanaerobaculia bacterium]|nr:lanthionine synthetase LanC family protein [Thermoanaerobaculia bacterium]